MIKYLHVSTRKNSFPNTRERALFSRERAKIRRRVSQRAGHQRACAGRGCRFEDLCRFRRPGSKAVPSSTAL